MNVELEKALFWCLNRLFGRAHKVWQGRARAKAMKCSVTSAHRSTLNLLVIWTWCEHIVYDDPFYILIWVLDIHLVIKASRLRPGGDLISTYIHSVACLAFGLCVRYMQVTYVCEKKLLYLSRLLGRVNLFVHFMIRCTVYQQPHSSIPIHVSLEYMYFQCDNFIICIHDILESSTFSTGELISSSSELWLT